MGVVQDRYGRQRPNPTEREVIAASTTDPAIVLCKDGTVWAYRRFDGDEEWEELPRLPWKKSSGGTRIPDDARKRTARAVLTASPPTVICQDGSIMELTEGEWKLRSAVPGSMQAVDP